MSEEISTHAAVQPVVQAEVWQTAQLPPQELAELGRVALSPELSGATTDSAEGWDFGAEKVAPNLRLVSVDGFNVLTNLPEGMLPLEPTPDGLQPKHPTERPLLPSALDAMPAGEFKLVNPNNERYNKTIRIIDAPDGKRVNAIANNGLIKNEGNNEALMTALGYLIVRNYEGVSVEGVPTPATVQEKAAKLGVDIQFFPDQSLINSKDYLQAFVSDKFPISTASAEYYMHDIADDHLTAIVLGGQPLKAALNRSASEALAQGLDADERADGIDRFTFYLRGAVSPTYNKPAAEVGHHGLETLEAAGKRIGLDRATVYQVLQTAQSNALKFGMDVIQYDNQPVSLLKAA